MGQGLSPGEPRLRQTEPPMWYRAPKGGRRHFHTLEYFGRDLAFLVSGPSLYPRLGLSALKGFSPSSFGLEHGFIRIVVIRIDIGG